jgi:ribosome-associated protein
LSFPPAPGPNGECRGDADPAAASSLEQPSELRLDQFLKWQGLVGTGGEAKFRIQQGDVRVNGELEQRRGRKLQPGDRVKLAGQELVVPAFQARR